MNKVVILGGGIAGITVAWTLKQNGIDSIIYEKTESAGGLCNSFEIDGFWFDNGGHCSFTKDESVKAFLEADTEIQRTVSQAVNYYKGIWVKHPVQNNLAVLSTEEKIKILVDMINRDDAGDYSNYKEWLVSKYGEYFALNFPCKYTRKYWTIDAEKMCTEWIGPRMYIPSWDEILYGAFEVTTKPVHYSGEIRYPVTGGYKHFWKEKAEVCDIRCNMSVKEIDTEKREISFENGSCIAYDILVSTLPLNKTDRLYKDVPLNIAEACSKLKQTSLVLVSLGVKGDIKIEDSFYVYDEDIIITRGYSTSKFGAHNAPDGCSSLQLEVYYSDYKKPELSLEEIKERVISCCVDMELIKEEDILVSDVRFIEYANVIFNLDTYDSRDIVHHYLSEKEVLFTGRFGDWDYLWVDQTIISAKKVADKIIASFK